MVSITRSCYSGFCVESSSDRPGHYTVKHGDEDQYCAFSYADARAFIEHEAGSAHPCGEHSGKRVH